MTDRKVDPSQYEMFESIILTEQMCAQDAASLMADDPNFAAWYRERMDRRRKTGESFMPPALPEGIERKIVFATADGKIHDSIGMAHQHLLFNQMTNLCAAWAARCYDVADIVNDISANSRLIRRFLDACEAMSRKT